MGFINIGELVVINTVLNTLMLFGVMMIVWNVGNAMVKREGRE